MHERDWLTHEEFARLLAAAEHPQRRRPGLVERDRLVLIALVLTGLRRSELIAVRWHDVDLDGPHPSLLVARGKGGKPRRQPVPSQLAGELERLRFERQPSPQEPVFCSLGGRRLQPTALARTISRCTSRAGLSKHVTAHTRAIQGAAARALASRRGIWYLMLCGMERCRGFPGRPRRAIP